MGQRSQIYVTWKNREGKNILVARYFQWNFGERMVSRAVSIITELSRNLKYEYLWSEKSFPERIGRFAEVNFDYRDICESHDIIKWFLETEDTDFNEYVFECQDNNDGQLFIKVEDGKIKYGFLQNDFNSDNVMNAEQYMDWDYPSWKQDLEGTLYQATLDNIEFINKNAELMTTEEIDLMRSANYLGGN